ncbi:MAG: gliding motility protein GldL [Sphingobacteriales bacterium]|jgi:gliding motility-associated protein GldL|nr:gliding motility protein GldL [Sphingobacteriales bacterium]
MGNYKKLMAKVYGIGAAVVIIGALFKILHLKFANELLIVGLTTEALIFFLSAFEKPHEEYDWSLVYPELAGMDALSSSAKSANNGTVSQQLDQMLVDAKIGPELIESLGAGLRTFGEKVSTISNVTDAATSSNEFANKLKQATKSVDDLTSAYSQASSSLTEIAASTTDSKMYHEQVQALAKNLSSLNAMYELELQDSNNHIKTLNKFYGNVSETMQSFSDSLVDARAFKDEVGKLSKNLASLNAVYGNMLSAMTIKSN